MYHIRPDLQSKTVSDSFVSKHDISHSLETQLLHSGVGSIYWKAPERFLNSDVISRRPDPSSDIYSLAMLFIEVSCYEGRRIMSHPDNQLYKNDDSSGCTPLPAVVVREYQVISYIVLSKQRPEKPRTMPTKFFRLCEDCWVEQPQERPTADEIRRRMKELIKNAEVREWSGPAILSSGIFINGISNQNVRMFEAFELVAGNGLQLDNCTGQSDES